MSKSIALVPGSMKPYHAGHDALVRIASSECDEVKLFVSTSDRVRKGEFPIYGKDMSTIWKTFIVQTLPENVEVLYGGSPVENVYNELVKAEEEDVKDVVYKIYSDDKDIVKYTSAKLRQYVPNLLKRKQIILRGVSRQDTVNVSGTLMRSYLASKNMGKFIAMLPIALKKNGRKIFDILMHKNKTSISESKSTTSLLRSYINTMLKA